MTATSRLLLALGALAAATLPGSARDASVPSRPTAAKAVPERPATPPAEEGGDDEDMAAAAASAEASERPAPPREQAPAVRR